MSYIELNHIQKYFDEKEVLKDVTLSIEKGEFVTFLGPSGCGKTTLLRCLVGLESVDGGNIVLDGNDITRTPAKQRGVSMIFQQYCLFPTMNIYDNISFGLRMKKVNKNEIKERVYDVLKMVNMTEHVNKYPHQLSGGEQQRAALARGLVMNPKVLLLDEPFSAIDAKLRKELQVYLKKTHRELNMTSVFVTHDQEEAMRMSDTIHLFNHGVLEQSDSPSKIYLHPKSAYVAGFIGSYNLLSGEILKMPEALRNVLFAVRPEVVEVYKETFEEEKDVVVLQGKITNQIPQGGIIRLVITVNGKDINVDCHNQDEFPYQIGETVFLKIPIDKIEKLER